jgi:ADP-ribose pyrophosphatase YjhB (NUDIX family)
MAQWHPHKTVATIVEHDGRFLMVEELIKGELVLNQPAGHLEANESLAQAAIRETLEETAWEVELTSFLGLYQQSNSVENITYIRCCFIAKALREVPGRELDTDIVRALWLTREELEARKAHMRSTVVLRVIDDYLQGKAYPLDVVQTLD